MQGHRFAGFLVGEVSGRVIVIEIDIVLQLKPPEFPFLNRFAQ